MSLARPSVAFEPSPTDPSFFERERERLVEEIGNSFEELMTHTNVLNRKLEEVYGVGKEFTTVAHLWGLKSAQKFNALIRDQQAELATGADAGVPGTGGANYGQSTNQQR